MVGMVSIAVAVKSVGLGTIGIGGVYVWTNGTIGAGG